MPSSHHDNVSLDWSLPLDAELMSLTESEVIQINNDQSDSSVFTAANLGFQLYTDDIATTLHFSDSKLMLSSD